MTQKRFLTIAALVAGIIGAIALFFPTTLLVSMKAATQSDIGIVMARTAGAFLLSIGVLNFMVRSHKPSPTMASIFLANALLQLLILPIDPLAYFTGVYGALSSFVPNTILHILLLAGFIHFWRKTKAEITDNS